MLFGTSFWALQNSLLGIKIKMFIPTRDGRLENENIVVAITNKPKTHLSVIMVKSPVNCVSAVSGHSRHAVTASESHSEP